MRYVNRFVDTSAESATAWEGRINDDLLGVVRHAELGARIMATQQQIELSLGESQGALIRHGLFRDGAARGAFSYLVDLDVFDSHTTAFDVDELQTRATTLNRTAMALFRQLVTDSYLTEMGDQEMSQGLEAEDAPTETPSNEEKSQ